MIRADGADGFDPMQAVAENSEVHRALEGLAHWQKTWRDDQLSPLEKNRIPIRGGPPSHLVYGRRQGRVIWFPVHFSRAHPSSRSLSCYHRNIAMATLQVESLLTHCRIAAAQTGRGLAGPLRDCAQHAAEILGRMHAGLGSTYRTATARVHVDQSAAKQDLNTTRQYFGLAQI